MTTKPFISVCVAIYNVDKYLYECLYSLKNQKLKNIEFILVDDCNTDNSIDICKKFCEQDSRFRLVNNKNQGLLSIRKAGIKESSGFYTVFIDGYDYYTNNESLEKIFNIVNKYNDIDIIRFGYEYIGEKKHYIINRSPYASSRKEKKCILDSFLALKYIYERCDSGCNLIFHAFKTQILKKIVDFIPDEYFTLSGDDFLLFISIYQSKNYAIIHSDPIYSYRERSDVSTYLIDIYHFRDIAKRVRITKWIDDKLQIDNCEKKYFYISKIMRHRLLIDTAQMLRKLPSTDQSQGFDLMVNEGYLPETVTAMREVYRDLESMRLLARNLYNASSLCFHQKSIKTIGILYHRYFDGGVERVISLQIPIFLRLGYRVVLFTEEINKDIEYPLPTCVRRVLLPRYYEDQRADALAKSLQSEGIDILLNHEYASENFLWDTIITKSINIPVILTLHSPCWNLILYKPYRESLYFEYAKEFIYRTADYLLILNNSFKKFFNAYGCRTLFVPNPHTFDFEHTEVPTVNKRNGVLWLGRLEDSSKNWRDALYIMEKITKLVPGTQCYIGGSEYDPGSVSELKEFISQHSLEQSVHWIGRRTDVKQLLQHCRVFLMTSSFEAFPMSLTEAKICGAPVIIYDIPYLEMLQDPKGVIIVPQRDTDAMIEQSIRVLQDNAYCEQLIRESRQSVEIFYKKYDLYVIWKNIFDSFNKNLIQTHEDKDLQQCFDLLLNATKRIVPAPFYNINWPKWKRLLFIVFFDRCLLKKKVKEKFYKYPMILNTMKFCYKSMRNIYDLYNKH